MPAEPELMVPGFDLASSTNSLRVEIPSEGGTTTMPGASPTSATPEKSAIGSNDKFLLMAPRIACPEFANSTVVPSAGALTTACAPIMPAAPARLATTTC